MQYFPEHQGSSWSVYTLKTIHETEKHVSSCCFDNFINWSIWGMESYLSDMLYLDRWNLPFSVFFHDWINKLIRIIKTCYIPYFQEYSDFLVDRVCMLCSQLSSFLLNRSESWVDVKLVACYVDVGECHLFRCPSEHINVLF